MEEMPLPPLSEEQTRTLVHSLQPSTRSRRDLDRAAVEIWTVSEGNPFVIVESVRALQEPPGASTGEPRLARNLHEFVAARLERLGTLARHVVAVAATYAHLSRQLPAGRRTWPPAAVKEILRRGRARFPDAILKALIQISVQFPVGGFVRLNSGEIARVVAKNEGLPLRPVVIVAGRTKQPAEPKRVDLRDNPFLFIVECLGAEAHE